MQKNLIPIGVALILLCGCSKSSGTDESPKTAQTAEAQTLPQTHIPTIEEWTAALKAASKDYNEREDEDGIKDYGAKFVSLSGKTIISFVKFDPFVKVRFYKVGIYNAIDINTYLKSYVSVLDGKMPAFVLAPYFFSKTGRLGLTEIAVLADDELILRRQLDRPQVQAYSYSWGDEERADFILTNAEIDNLRRVAKKAVLKIRLTGDHGYALVKKDMAAHVRDDLRDELEVYDQLSAALKGKEIK